jgi:diguanylate cyclase (GGDEF)-like protein
VYRILTCLTVQHEPWLVVLAAFVCSVAALASFKIYSHVLSSNGLQRVSLLLLTGVCSASGIWATHFIAMLAYDAGFPIAYEPVTTAASFFIAVVATTLGFAISASGSRWQPSVGGAVIGVGIGLMHYTGMLALIIPGTLHWEIGLVVASLAIGTALASISQIAFSQLSGRRALWISAGFFVLAICGLHFTAMGAATVVPDPTIFVPPSPFDASVMAFTVSGATLVIMLSGIASTALMENDMRRRREEELRRAKNEIEKQKHTLNATMQNVSQGVCMFDAAQRLIVCNKRYADLYGLNDQQTKPGTTLRTILEHRIARGNAPDDYESYINERISEVTANKPYQITNKLRDGRFISVVHRPLADGGWVATHEDVTDWKRAEQRIARMAHYDTLTDLPNRATLNDTIDATLHGAATRGEQFTILSLDLDRFKETNDTYGHLVGDALLREVAHRLQSAAEGTFLARIGGDEFVAIVTAGVQPAAASALAERLLAAFVNDFKVEGRLLKLSLSIGGAVYPTDGADAKTLMTNADAALYHAKAEMRGTALFYQPEIGARLRDRRALQADLRLALDRGELLLHYQPQKKMSGETIGFEALVRWRCAKHGMVAPGTFIPAAEENNLIIPIGGWSLYEACREAASWPQPLSIAVNISPIQFNHGDLSRLVHSVLLETGLAPGRLELEITEGALINDFSHALSILNQLKSLGVKIVMDDFGTGYSSLSYLHSFSCDKIKIDRIFISDLEQNHHSRAIVRAVIGLGHNLTLPILAEGVETEAQHALLVQEGCDEMQGYLTGRPLPISDYADLVGHQPTAQQNYAVAR